MVAIVLVAISVAVPRIAHMIHGTTALMTPREAFIPTAFVVHLYWFSVAWLLERVLNAFLVHGLFDPKGARFMKWLGGLLLGVGALHFLTSVLEFTQTLRGSAFGDLFTMVPIATLGGFFVILGWALEESREPQGQREQAA